MIVLRKKQDLGKKQALVADQKTIQQINFTATLDRGGNATILFIIEEGKEAMLDYSQGTVKVLWSYFVLI